MKTYTYTLSKDGASDLEFKGTILASVSSSPNRSCRDFSGSSGRWQTLRLFQTDRGDYVCQLVYLTLREGETDSTEEALTGTLDGARDFFGHGWLAKELYNKADCRLKELAG